MANPDIGIVIGAQGLSSYLSDMNRATQAGRNFANSAQNSANVVDKEFSEAARSVSRLADETSSVSKSFGDLAKDLPGIGSVLGFIGNPIGGIITGLGAAGLAIGTFIDDAARFEEIQIQFETLIGDTDRARDALDGLSSFAATTPFQLEDIAQAGRNLLAFGTSAETLEETLRRLGDISSGIGAPLTEIAEIYGKIQVQGRVFGEDINQLLGRGIPIVEELAKQFNVTGEEVKQLVSEGAVGFPQIEEAFRSLTSEGGRFFGLTNNLASSFSGQVSTLRDNFAELSRNIGQRLLPAATATVGFLNELIGGTSRYSDELRNEQTELNVLIQRIGRYNEGNEDRQRLIGELNQKYPDFLGNLDSETVTNGELRDRLKEVNEQYVNRIILQQEQEKIDEQATEFAKDRRRQAELQLKLEQDLEAAKRFYNVAVADGLSLEQEQLAVRNALVAAALAENRNASTQNDTRLKTAQDLSDAYTRYTNAVRAANNEEYALNQLQTQREEIAKRLGINLTELSTETEKIPGRIETEVDVKTESSTKRVKSLNEQLAELGVNLAALNNFNELTGLAEAIPLESIRASAERAKEAITDFAIAPDASISSLNQRLGDMRKALELIDPQSAGFEVLAQQAAALEARINRVNNELDRLSEGGPRQPIVFPIEADTTELENVTLSPPGLELRADLKIDIPNGGSLATLSEAARVLGTDIDFLKENFRDTQEILDTMDGTAFKLGETLSGSTEKALRFAVELRDVWAEIGQSILNNFTQQMQDLGAQIGEILVDTIGKGSAEQRAAVADLEAQIASLDKELENLPKDSESFRIIQKQADALRGQLGLLESATGRMGQAFAQFAREVLAMVLSEGARIAGVFIMQAAIGLGWPVGLPVFIAGAALAGLSGLIPKLILGDDNQDTSVATPDFNSSGIGTGGGGFGGGNFGGAAGFTSGELVQNSLNTIQAAGQPTAVNVVVQLDSEEISTALTVYSTIEQQLTGG